MKDSTREAFEAWIAAPPFEKSAKRHGEDSAWCGAYADIAVDLAWNAWLESGHHEAQRTHKTPTPEAVARLTAASAKWAATIQTFIDQGEAAQRLIEWIEGAIADPADGRLIPDKAFILSSLRGLLTASAERVQEVPYKHD